MTRPFPFPARTGLEPTIGELLDDPVLRYVLNRDGLSVADVRAVIIEWQQNQKHAWFQSTAA